MRGAEQDRYRAVIGHFATGVTVVTAHARDVPAGMTANAVCSVSLEPLLLLVCFERSARTLSAVRETGRFGVNVLSREQRDVSRVFASKAPEVEKFAAAGALYELRGGVPILAGTLAWLVCDVQELIEGGDHVIAMATVADMGHSEEREPLVWYRGEYRTIGQSSPHLGLAPD